MVDPTNNPSVEGVPKTASVPDRLPTIAVVEDDASVNKAIARLLGVSGFEVMTFDSAEAFLSRDSNRQFDCLVLDVTLPGLSGIELHHRLMTSGVSRPVVFITAHEEPIGRAQMDQSGMAAYLTKPFRARALINAVTKACTSSP
jgi:FixJ family two-component response regulator